MGAIKGVYEADKLTLQPCHALIIRPGAQAKALFQPAARQTTSLLGAEREKAVDLL